MASTYLLRFAFKQHFLIGKGKLEETYDTMSNGHINDPKTSPNVGFGTFVPRAVFALRSGGIRSIFKSTLYVQVFPLRCKRLRDINV